MEKVKKGGKPRGLTCRKTGHAASRNPLQKRMQEHGPGSMEEVLRKSAGVGV
jgi:hypothetical protein